VQANWEGAVEAEKEFGIEFEYVENVTPTEDEYVQQSSAYARKGADLVMMVVGTVPGAVTTLARQFPDTIFCIDGIELEEPIPENACAYDPQQQLGGFMAGALAASVTKTDKIGVVAGFTMPAQVRQVEGFALGARYINPDIEVEQVYINSLTDVSAAKSAAQSQYDAGADIVLAAVDQATEGVIQAARESRDGGKVIASYFDASDEAPDVIIASVLYALQDINKHVIELAMNGELENKNYLFGPEFGVGRLTGFNGVDQGVQDRMQELQDELEAGTLVLPSTADLLEEGIGFELDPKSLEKG
jgi:basic membrane protein A